jgi:small-conductance mechanosensitive channel
MLALGAVALAATPVLATSLMGIVVVYGRRLRIGEFAALGGHRGRVLSVGLLEVRLESSEGEVRIPHLASLLAPTVLFGRFPTVAVEIHVGPDADRRVAEDALLDATSGIGTRPHVEMLQTGASGTRYRLSVGSELGDGRGRLLRAVLAALDERGLALGADGAKVL